MKTPFRWLLHKLLNPTARLLCTTKKPLQWLVQGTVAATRYVLLKMQVLACLFLSGIVMVATTSFHKKIPAIRTVTANTYRVVVIKSSYELKVYDSAGEWLVTYPVVFGNKDIHDKMMEGDRRTPEGIFHIRDKRRHPKWKYFMLIDYPTADSYRKFNERKAKGMIPAYARIGGSIGIHGTWPNEDYAIDQYQNWTEGCISTKNTYAEEIFQLLPVGTAVEIRR